MLAPLMMAHAAVGFQERSESVAMNWGDYPTRLDDTVFTAALGGGGNMLGIRTYLWLPPNDDFTAWFKPPVSLDRVQKFIPIATEIRQAEAMPVEAAFFGDGWTNWLLTGAASPWGPDVGEMLNMAQAHIMLENGPWDAVHNRKMLFAVVAGQDTFKQATIDRLVQYVENGGTLVMLAGVGRKSVEKPTEDWVLLRRFGFTPPSNDQVSNFARAYPVVGEVFRAEAKPFELNAYPHTVPQNGAATAACFDDDPNRPAMSWKSFGQGKVLVVWANQIVPPAMSAGDGRTSYPILRDLARWGGVRLYIDCDNPWFWVNLLKAKTNETYYALAARLIMFPPWRDSDQNVVNNGTITFLALPDGRYQVTELISGRDLGARTGAELREQGISATLAFREVAVYRLKKVE
ncbi:MAG: hypothetical protein GYA33_06965 [Thermogutta sp.]|nr:hypothetical protein [Thermogutta sp.]